MTAADTPRWRRGGFSAGVVLALALFTAGGGIAQAYWSSVRTQAGSSIAAVSIPAPATVGCTNQSILLVAVAKVSWSAVSGAGGYRVTVSRASGGAPLIIDQTATSIDLSTGVLGDLLSGLLSPTVLTVKVQPYQDAGVGGRWVSSASISAQANARLLPIGTTCA